MNSRSSIGYIIKIEGSRITLNLFDIHKGAAVGHSSGVSEVSEIGTLLAIDAGIQVLVFKVDSLSFAEPKDVHRSGIRNGKILVEPLRHMTGRIVGSLKKLEGVTTFTPTSILTPPLGAEVFPLLENEISAILGKSSTQKDSIIIGKQLKGGEPVHVNKSDFIGRHVAVLGGTGQGKSCFTASVLQKLVQSPKSRIVVFDINGEYEGAFDSDEYNKEWKKVTRIGSHNANVNSFTIPYYALGRHGLQRLLLPSEKTQRPALNFALEHLDKVKWWEKERGVGLSTDTQPSLFDDCRSEKVKEAFNSITQLRKGDVSTAEFWPPMVALGPLIAESHSLMPANNGSVKRDAFTYGNVAPLITRLHRFVEDPMFNSVVNINASDKKDKLNWKNESIKLVEKIFGNQNSNWRLHIVNLHEISHDLAPFILGALLDLYAFELFRRGQKEKKSTLLVLEEAHHYLRSAEEAENNKFSSIAYERLAKEGRKFGLSLWLSTQRPSELSSTVLSQCNNWVCFRLTSDRDLATVQSANEWTSRQEVQKVAGLSRKQALVFGGSLNLPLLIESNDADPLPLSQDAQFDWGQNEETTP